MKMSVPSVDAQVLLRDGNLRAGRGPPFHLRPLFLRLCLVCFAAFFALVRVRSSSLEKMLKNTEKKNLQTAYIIRKISNKIFTKVGISYKNIKLIREIIDLK